MCDRMQLDSPANSDTISAAISIEVSDDFGSERLSLLCVQEQEPRGSNDPGNLWSGTESILGQTDSHSS